ncbi:MAG: hypothetical protein TEF_01650 [Rhizobiales bacterium NRL2]|jgi:hypothetical protein|nr:MAG: hypothetical protein TEF_01650 [Rhizobiales bacterium NRL2]
MSGPEPMPLPAVFRVELDPELAVVSPVLAEALRLWEALRGPRQMPARRDFDPAETPRALLPHILLIDVDAGEGAESRFRWRLIGTHVTTMLGRDMTGRWFDEIYDAGTLTSITTGPRWVLANRRPVRTVGQAPVDERSYLRSENLHMPLSDDGRRVDKILVATDLRSIRL